MNSLSQFYQAQADNSTNAYGSGVARLAVAENLAKEALKFANTFPSSLPANANLPQDTGPTLIEMAKKHLTIVQEQRAAFQKDNDYIYHQTVPSESTLPAIPKLPASKAIPVQ